MLASHTVILIRPPVALPTLYFAIVMRVTSTAKASVDTIAEITERIKVMVGARRATRKASMAAKMRAENARPHASVVLDEHAHQGASSCSPIGWRIIPKVSPREITSSKLLIPLRVPLS